MTISAPTPAKADETTDLRDELFTYAAQLIRAETQAGFAGKDLAIRVKEPAHLAHLLTRAGSALQARTKMIPLAGHAAEIQAREAAEARAALAENVAGIRKAEAEAHEIAMQAIADARRSAEARADRLAAENAVLSELLRGSSK